MYGNQILKYLSPGAEEWKSEAYTTQQETLKHLIKRGHHFYFGSYGGIESDVAKRVGNKILFMGDLANNLKLPYDTFLLCVTASSSTENVPHAKYAMLIQKYDIHGSGITVDYLLSDGSNWWILLPLTRLYVFNMTLADATADTSFKDKIIVPDSIGSLHKSNTGIIPFVNEKHASQLINSEQSLSIQKTLGSIINYFLLLYNQKYIVTETIYKDKVNRKMKKNKNRLFDYKILSVQLPKSGKKYRYDQRDKQSKGIMPFTEVPGTWKTYAKESPMFGNPKLFGDFWIPDHVRGSKQTGFVSNDYYVKTMS